MLAVSFLVTRVKAPNVDDWKKLGQCLSYLEGTPDLDLTLSADGSGIVPWWVDTSPSQSTTTCTATQVFKDAFVLKM